MILLVNNWFDLLNSQNLYENNTTAYGNNIEEQNQLLDKMDDFIKSMRVHGKRCLMQFQKGILLSNRSLRNLYMDMKTNYNLEYILTRRLNQDVLEIFFSFLRGMGGANDHPTPLDFKYR